MDVKLATLIKSLNIMDVIFSGFTVTVYFLHCHFKTEYASLCTFGTNYWLI